MRSEVRSFCWKDFPSSPAVGGWTFLFFRWQKYLWSRRELSRLLEPETKRLKSQTLVEREEEEGNHGGGGHLGPEIDQLLMSRGHFELIASAHNCSPVSHFVVWLWCRTSWEGTSVITGMIRSTDWLAETCVRAYYKPSARSDVRRTPCLGNYTAALSDPCKRTENQNIHYFYVVSHVFRDENIYESDWSFMIVAHFSIHGKSRE